MKILQVIPELKLAGAQIMVEGLVEKLIADGHQVEIVSLYSFKTPLTERLLNNQVKIHFLGKKKGFDILAAFRLKKIIKNYHPDVIHTHTYALKYVYFAAKSSYSGKIIHTIHNMANKETTAANRKLEKKLFKKGVVQPVAISPIVKQSVLDYYELPEKRVPMVFNGISLQNCIRKTTYRFTDETIRLIHIGRLQEQKNHDMMIDAIKIVSQSIPNICLHCFGAGPLEEQLKQRIIHENISNNMILEGLTDKQYEELNKADIFLLPSNWEGMPITLIEAMGTGLPIIVTPVGGIPDMIEDNYSGIVCDLTATGLATAIIKMVEDNGLREKVGNNAYKESNRFSSEKMAKLYEKVYENCIKAI